MIPKPAQPFPIISRSTRLALMLGLATLLVSGCSVRKEDDGANATSGTTAPANQAAGTVRATAWVRHRGKSTVLTAVDITGEGGKLLATGEFTFFCVDKALMDQKAAAAGK